MIGLSGAMSKVHILLKRLVDIVGRQQLERSVALP